MLLNTTDSDVQLAEEGRLSLQDLTDLTPYVSYTPQDLTDLTPIRELYPGSNAKENLSNEMQLRSISSKLIS